MRNDHFLKDLQRFQMIQSIADPDLKQTELHAYAYPKPSEFYEYALVIVNWVFACVLLMWMISSMTNPLEILWAVPWIPVCLFIADFMSAGFHKWLDSYASENNIFWGSAARAFRIHHQFPNNLNDVGYFHNVSAFSPMIFGFYLVFAALLWFKMIPFNLSIMVWVLILLFAHGTEIHKRSHMRNPGALFSFFQKRRIFLNSKVHNQHHRRHIDSDYGIINGWSNFLFKKITIWEQLDAVLWKYLKVLPHNWVHCPQSIPGKVIQEFKQKPQLIPEEIFLYAQVFQDRSAPKAVLEELRSAKKSQADYSDAI
jgi:hypothetical protein